MLLMFVSQSEICQDNFFSFFFFKLGVVRPVSRTPLGELKQSNASVDRMYKWVMHLKSLQIAFGGILSFGLVF